MWCCGRRCCGKRSTLDHDLLEGGDEEGDIDLSKHEDSAINVAPVAYHPPVLEVPPRSSKSVQSTLELLPSASCQRDYSHSGLHYSTHVAHSGELKVSYNVRKSVWDAYSANLEGGVLLLARMDDPTRKLEYHLDEMMLKIVDPSAGIFEVAPVEITASSRDQKTFGTSIFATPDAFPEWIRAVDDAIKVCRVKSILSTERSPTAVQWYKTQYDQYEEALNVLEFGGHFVLHQRDRQNQNFDQRNYADPLHIWLQAEVDDNGLVIFPAGDDKILPSTSLSLTSREKSMSNAERLIEFRGEDTKPVIAATLLNAESIQSGVVLLFHDILSISRGSKEKIAKVKSHSGCFTITTSQYEYIIEADTKTKRDQWAKAVTDVIQFCHIPNPNISAGL